MPFSAALTTPQYELLRGTSSVNPTYDASDYVIFCPNTPVFEARINGAPTGASYAQVTFDSVTLGSYTDIQMGQTILISPTADMRQATFTGIIRKAPTSTIIYINETSVSLPDNAYITVIKDFRLIDKLARQVGNTQYKFYDIPYQTTPPLIYNLQSAYAAVADAVTNVYTVDFAPLGLPITSGATISSWLWTIPSGVTITSGSTTTQNITVEIDAGTADWITLRARDSNTHDGFFHFFVASVPFDLSSVITPAVNGISFSCNENGWSGSIVAFDGVEDILDNTLCIVLSAETYNNTESNINGAVKFVGRLRKENNQTAADETYGVVQQAAYELEGALAQFGRVEHLPFTLRNTASPTVWDELTNQTVWRAIAYTLFWHTNYLDLFALSFDSVDNTYLYPLLPTQGGQIQAVIADLAVSLDATLESAATGETRIYRNALYQTTAQRNALVTVANYDEHDWMQFALDVLEVDTAGKVQASGGYFNAASGTVTALLSLAPGIAQGTGAEVTNLTRQILAATSNKATAQAELNTRSGNHYAIVQREQPILTVTHPDGYTFITPSLSQWYTFDISASDDTGGRAYTSADRWQCISYSVTHDSALGTNDIQAVYRLESVGTPGQTVNYPPPGAISPALPTIPPISAFPSLPPLPTITMPPIPTIGDTPPYTTLPITPNGNLIGLLSDIDVWNTPNALMTPTPTYNDLTPSTAFSLTDFQWIGMGYKGAYCIGNNGVDSTFFYSEDATIATPTWTSTDVTGVYTVIRPTSTPGSVYIGGFDLAGKEVYLTSNFTGTFISRVGGVLTCSAQTGGGGAGYTIYLQWANSGGSDVPLYDNVNDCGHLFFNVLSGTTAGAFNVYTDCGSTSGGIWGLTPIQDRCTSSITFTDANPFTIEVWGTGCSGGTTVTRFSTDFGATFDSPVTVGDSINGTVMDTVKVGDTVLAVMDGQVMKATSGGAYSAYGDPLPTGFFPQAIFIPFYKFGSTTVANNSTNPEYLIAANAVDGASASLYKVTSSGTVFTDITPLRSGNPGLAVSEGCITMPFKSGKRLAAVLSFSGTRRLATTIDSGVTWVTTNTVGTGAQRLSMRRSDTTLKQIAIANGSTGLLVSQDFGVNLLSKGTPSDDAIVQTQFFG